MTPKQEAALRQALENICAAKLCEFNSMSSRHEMIRLMDDAITAIREALAEQPAQVDPCIDGSCSCCWTHLDEQPASKPWVGLTDEERIMCRSYDPEEAVAKTEAKLKERNT